MITGLDHINLRTARLDVMVDWYCDMLGLRAGARPDFGMPGAWLYAGAAAVVHLVEVPNPPAPPADLTLEHAAFRATGLAGFLSRLDAAGQAYSPARVPGWPIIQINLHDPDGNHLHIDFSADEPGAVAIA